MDNIFFEIHGDIPREGPGDTESTRRAFSMLTQLPLDPAILDVGSGPGMQTLELAKICNDAITALDNNRKLLDELERRAQGEGLDGKIKTTHGSMFSMPFDDGSFDLIWSEGAIFIIGFEEGLKEWKRFLKPSGYMAVTHISWLKSDIPHEPQAFWSQAYPKGLRSVDENLKIAANAGYKEVGHFTLPESAWWNDYYTPLENKLSPLREKYKDNSAALAQIEDTQQEINLYRKYSDCYGYVFYVLQKVF
jgi:ubiquinone/menaquinone biosynthesis C-methylase UbiE